MTNLISSQAPTPAPDAPEVEETDEYFASHISLGGTYTDSFTKYTGVATQVCFNIDGTHQVMLETVADSQVRREWFDSGRVVEGSRHPLRPQPWSM